MNKPIEIKGDCQFMRDLESNNKFAIYNLIVSKSAVRLWTKGIKPNRHWKITDVKKYFGMNGTPKILLEKMETLHKVIMGDL
jgi:thioredoxin-related protein